MDKDKLIKDAQYRKGLSIAYFNSLNCAIDLVTRNSVASDKQTDEELIDRVVKVRDIFIDQHERYYSNVISKVGKNYDVSKAIEKLKTAKTLSELSERWIMLSEDERRDDEIRKVAGELKKQYANTQ